MVTERLRERYRSTTGPVAFLDESYQLDPSEPEGLYYIMTATVVARNVMDRLRTDLDRTAGHRLWHTTEALLQGSAGHKATLAMLRVVAATPNVTFLVHHQKVTPDATGGWNDGGQAREECFRGLAARLSRQVLPTTPDPVNLMVLDKRKYQNQQRFDEQIVKRIRATKIGHRNLQLVQAQPSEEPLLYLPDLVAAAYRRGAITHTNNHTDAALLNTIRTKVGLVSPRAQDGARMMTDDQMRALRRVIDATSASFRPRPAASRVLPPPDARPYRPDPGLPGRGRDGLGR
ncbi:hypothetical protein [Tsukamurella spumae]|uniref:DUF3800 domain-containing protein n=1 Tax=Tsukamurella spumae TaxID=44753 RepID=A0A846X2Z0_9ACTN|nr:hypothetical protein [Tsukamurella spumae]NKY19523.1 hypothetical protein [Tsukamurella spumae]